jgi:Flp pilus assembly pilin Flp
VRIDERREVNQMLKLFTFVQAAADSLRKREEGQTMAEYGVVLAVITLAVIGAITLRQRSQRDRERGQHPAWLGRPQVLR